MESRKWPQAIVSAQLSVSPPLSQSVLTVIVLISIIPLATGLYFIWHGKEGAWIALILFIFLIMLASIGWWHSQSLIDMGNASPTQITDRHGNSLITDTRVLESNNAISQLAILLRSLESRSPLPEPDGLVDAESGGSSDRQEESRESEAGSPKVITIEPDRTG